MSEFSLQFAWREDVLENDALIDLEAATLEQAKAKAAMLYAGASFKAVPPCSFRILHRGEAEVYRFPESA